MKPDYDKEKEEANKNHRILEIENEVELFNRNLQASEKRFEELKLINSKNKSPEKKHHEKKKSFTDNIFKDPPSWKPNNGHGEYFDEFKKLNSEHDMNAWEINRVNILPRSFIKANELKKKDFAYTNHHGGEFGEAKINSLSELGRSIVSRFIKENESKESTIKLKDEEYFKYKHSKPLVNYNSWKFSNHVIEEFSKCPGDDIYAFKPWPKSKNLISQPFKRPKRDGEFFEKGIKLI